MFSWIPPPPPGARFCPLRCLVHGVRPTYPPPLLNQLVLYVLYDFLTYRYCYTNRTLQLVCVFKKLRLHGREDNVRSLMCHVSQCSPSFLQIGTHQISLSPPPPPPRNSWNLCRLTGRRIPGTASRSRQLRSLRGRSLSRPRRPQSTRHCQRPGRQQQAENSEAKIPLRMLCGHMWALGRWPLAFPISKINFLYAPSSGGPSYSVTK